MKRVGYHAVAYQGERLTVAERCRRLRGSFRIRGEVSLIHALIREKDSSMNGKMLWLFGGVAIAAGTVGGVVGAWIAAPNAAEAAARRPSGVETNELRLIDDKGNVRALMGLDDSGNPRLSFFDESGTIRVWTGITPQGIAMVNLRDSEGNSRLFVQVDENSPLFSMRDSEDVGRVYLQVSADEPLLNLRDKSDKGGVYVKVADDGPVLWFTDENGNTTYQQR